MLDVIVRGGQIVDGLGGVRRRGDLGILGGRVVAMGSVQDQATSVIDADGLIVAPGFIDIHTHYDPHVMWDRAVTPSSLHGVTTVVGGNCGFTLAPMIGSAADYLVPMLARVEGMPLAALEAGLDLGWSSFGEWLAGLDDRIGINVGFLAGHSTIRRVVMGDRAVGETASEPDLGRMTSVLRECLRQGALGFSSSWNGTHTDHHGDPVPSRWASREELLALCRAVRDHPGTTLEFIPSSRQFWDLEEHEVMTAMSVAADRPLNWNLLRAGWNEETRAAAASRLAGSDHAARGGGRVVPLTLPEPFRIHVNFYSGFLLDTLPDWNETMSLPLEQRLQALARPEVRSRLAAGARRHVYKAWADWPRLTVAGVGSPELERHVGRTTADLAAEQRGEPFDALLDLVIEDRGRSIFEPPTLDDGDDTWAERAALWRDPRVLIGGSDAGAHLDMMKTFACHTRFLAEAVRRRGLLPLEEAIRLITSAPAALYGLRDRGRLAIGSHADVVIFDEDEVEPGEIGVRFDLPAGAGRLYSEPSGIHHVLVNGQLAVTDGSPTGTTAGRVLQSGHDTETVPAS